MFISLPVLSRCCLASLVACLSAAGVPNTAVSSGAQPQIRYAGPIIDVHLHTDPPASAIGMPNPVTGMPAAASADALREATLQECTRLNIVRAVLNGAPGTLARWQEADPARFLAAPMILGTSGQTAVSVD